MIRPITATVPACYGLTCPHHATCQRYAAVEQAASPDHTIGTCADGQGGWPLRSPLQLQPTAPAQALPAEAA